MRKRFFIFKFFKCHQKLKTHEKNNERNCKTWILCRAMTINTTLSIRQINLENGNLAPTTNFGKFCDCKSEVAERHILHKIHFWDLVVYFFFPTKFNRVLAFYRINRFCQADKLTHLNFVSEMNLKHFAKSFTIITMDLIGNFCLVKKDQTASSKLLQKIIALFL